MIRSMKRQWDEVNKEYQVSFQCACTPINPTRACYSKKKKEKRGGKSDTCFVRPRAAAHAVAVQP